jgi:ankyrin repeat protein
MNDHTANEIICDSAGRLPLHCVAQNGDVDAMVVLMDSLKDTNQSAKICTRDSNQMTALHYAALGGHFLAGQVLCRPDIENLSEMLNAQNDEGNTPLHIVASCKTTDWKKFIELLLDSGANIGRTNVRNQTWLHCLSLNSSIPDSVFASVLHSISTRLFAVPSHCSGPLMFSSIDVFIFFCGNI